MTTANQALPLSAPPRAPDPRLWVSLAASALAHAVALLIFAALLLPMPGPVWVKRGQPATLQVLLTGPAPAESQEPATMAADVGPPAPALEPLVTPPPPPRPPDPVPERPAPALRSDPLPAAAPTTGTTAPIDPEPDAVAADAPVPPGDVAVGAAESMEVLGRMQALRLAQRFPKAAAVPPQLVNPLVVPYPTRAARARREARIDVLLIVDSSGKVLETTLVPDDPVFGPTVQAALAGAQFKPAEVDSRPTTHWVILEFVFKMRPTRAPRTAAAR
jgi:hypothetical protein